MSEYWMHLADRLVVGSLCLYIGYYIGQLRFARKIHPLVVEIQDEFAAKCGREEPK